MNKQELQNEFWNKIYDDYAKVILNIAADILKDEYLAQDVVQEVMYKYYVYLRENDVEFEKSWLIKVTKNVSFNLVKKLKHELDYIDFEMCIRDRCSNSHAGADRSIKTCFAACVVLQRNSCGSSDINGRREMYFLEDRQQLEDRIFRNSDSGCSNTGRDKRRERNRIRRLLADVLRSNRKRNNEDARD